jgi:hypothetical protein
VHILQGYDEYIVAYTESRDVINIAQLPLGTPNENTLIHGILLDSQTVGFWRRVVERSGITARPTMAVKLTARQRRAIEAAFARYAEFAGVAVTVDW